MHVQQPDSPARGRHEEQWREARLRCVEVNSRYDRGEEDRTSIAVPACVPVNDLSRLGLQVTPQVEGMTCVVGPVAIWLKNLNAVRNFLDRERFERSVSGQENSDYA